MAAQCRGLPHHPKAPSGSSCHSFRKTQARPALGRSSPSNETVAPVDRAAPLGGGVWAEDDLRIDVDY